MKIFFQIIKNTWGEYMMYRLNFLMWRVRMVLQVLITYFLWRAIFSSRQDAGATFFGYTQAVMLTYILVTSIVRTTVLSTTTMEVGDIINQGKLSHYLVRPMSFFSYYIARDIGDKTLNILFAVGEIFVLFLVLRPPVVIQYNGTYIILAIVAAIIAMVLYFVFSMLLGLLGFWTPEVWGPRFLSIVVIEFFAGSLFPLDILPAPLFAISRILPFGYFIYFPIKVYLGQLPLPEVIGGLTLGCIWVGVLGLFTQYIWHRGLRIYSAEGR